jgi:hypothetical protein
MDSDLLTLGGLALVLAAGWMVDHLEHLGLSPLRREIASQLKKSADTIRGPLN